MDTSPLTRIMLALQEGPGTAPELAAELDLCPAACSSYLYRLWCRGWIERSRHQIRHARAGRHGVLYGLPDDITQPQPRSRPVRTPRAYASHCAYARPAARRRGSSL